MHHELKALIAQLPTMIIDDFDTRAVPFTTDVTFPLTVPAIFSIVRAELTAQAGVYCNTVDIQAHANNVLNARYKLYRHGENQNLSRLLMDAVRAVLSQISPELQVALSALLLKQRSESDLLKMLGTHYANDMDKDLPYYVQLAKDWHREWCNSSVPEGMIDEKYPHDQVPVVTFMRAITAIARGNAAETAGPWLKEVNNVIESRISFMSPTEAEALRIIACDLTPRDVNDDFLKYFL